LYLETLGAVLLLVSGGVGFLMLGSGPGRIEPSAAARVEPLAAGRAEPSEPDGAVGSGDDEPPAPGTESLEFDPNAPQSPKGPLSLRDTGRRKWSAS
jgi:hypothetical protein